MEEEHFDVEGLCDIDGDVPMPPAEDEGDDAPGGVPHPVVVEPRLGVDGDGAHGVADAAGISVQEKLRAEATSAAHKLTHLPKNPYCSSCQLGKMKERYSRRGAFRRQLTKWGELVTFDHIYSKSLHAIGIRNEHAGFVIKDLFTGIVQVYPVLSKAAEQVVAATKLFAGKRKIQQAYSDNAPGFIRAMCAMCIPLETCTPGIPHANATIERSVQLVVCGTTTCMIEAGVPPCFWSYACPVSYTHLTLPTIYSV